MYTIVIENDLKLWREVAKSTLHSGNKVGSARLHALQMMVDEAHDTALYWDVKYKPTLLSVSKLCQFAKKEHVTANEKNIFIHIIIDLLEIQLKNLPTEPPRRLVDWHVPEQFQNSGDDPFYPFVPPPQDIEENPPPAELGDIPF